MARVSFWQMDLVQAPSEATARYIQLFSGSQRKRNKEKVNIFMV